ncbi:MAG: hypothetical protein AAB035_03800 [Nitrospirota bacterium]
MQKVHRQDDAWNDASFRIRAQAVSTTPTPNQNAEPNAEHEPNRTGGHRVPQNKSDNEKHEKTWAVHLFRREAKSFGFLPYRYFFIQKAVASLIA